jgi:hypothetical protein
MELAAYVLAFALGWLTVKIGYQLYDRFKRPG